MKYVVQIVCTDVVSAHRVRKVVLHLVDNHSERDGKPPAIEKVELIEKGYLAEFR